MKRFFNMWATLALAIVLAWGASYFAPVASAADKPERISVAYCADCVQFHFQNKDGKADGLIIDMWRLWSERTGIAVDFKAATWEETLRMVGDGRADAHAGLFFNEERAKFLEYGTSLTETDTQFFVHKDLPGIEKVEDLTAYKVGVVSGDYVEGFLKKKLPPENIVAFESYEAIMEALREGRLQVFAADTSTGIFHLQKAGLGYVFEAPASKPLYTQKWFVATTKGNTELINVINAGMDLVSKSERREIERRWASISNPVVFDAEKTAKRLNLTVQERQWLADHPVIRVHNETDWPPFNFFDDAKPQGFSIDYMNLLASMIGVKVDYVTGPTWNEFLGLMKSGDLDVMLNIVQTPERQKYLLFTKPYLFNPNTILSRREAPYDDLEQLSGKTVALPKGFFYEEILKRDYPRIKLHLVENVTESMKAVAFGRADAALGELAVFNYLLGRQMMTGLVLSGEVRLGGANYNQLNIATRKDQTILISILTKAMNAVAPEEIKALRQLWINVAATAIPKALKLKLTDGEKAWLAEHRTMRLGIDRNYPPFEFVGEDEIYSGMASDYARLVGERLGVTLEVVPGLSWSQVIEGVKSGAVDVLPAVTKTPERDEFMNFSREHLIFPDVIFMRDGHSLIAGMPDMKGRKVALVEGYATAEHIMTKYPTIQSLIVESPLLALKAVAEGKADATVQNLGVATYLIKKHDLTNLVVAAPADLDLPGLSFGVRKDWPELVLIIDKVLASIKPEEEAIIREKWGSTQYQIGINIATIRRVALQAGGAGAVIVIVIVLWNRRLSREVKQRKQAEQELAAKEAQLRVALDNMPGGMALSDRDLKYVLFNSQYSELYGFPDGLVRVGGSFRDEMRFQADRGDFGPGDKDGLIERATATYQRGEAVSFEREIAGSGRTLQVYMAPTPEGGHAQIVTDITERKRAEEALRESEEQVRLLLDSTAEAIYGIDIDGECTFCNPVCVAMLGYDGAEDLLGRHIHDLIHHTRPDGTPYPAAECLIYQAFREGEGTHVDNEVLWRQDGTSFPAEYWSYPIHRDGEIVGAVVTFLDITDRKRAEAELQAAHGIIKDQKERMESELNVGHEIQMSFVPDFSSLPDHAEFSICATLEPAREVGGDFYDSYFLDEELFCFCIADVSGKGVPAALFMAMAKTLIKSRAADDRSTASILTHVNDELSVDNPNCMFVTVFAGILNIRSGELLYTNAGHNPPYIRRKDGALQRLDKCHGPAIGAMEEMVYKEERDRLQPGDLLFLYTDGVTEAMDPEHRLFSEDRLKDLLTATATKDVQTAVDHTVAAVIAFEGEAERTDDVTVLALEFHGRPEDAPRAE